MAYNLMVARFFKEFGDELCKAMTPALNNYITESRLERHNIWGTVHFVMIIEDKNLVEHRFLNDKILFDPTCTDENDLLDLAEMIGNILYGCATEEEKEAVLVRLLNVVGD